MDAKEIKKEESDQDPKEAAAHHGSHDISYSTGMGPKDEITCDRAQTIVEALQINYTDKKHKELVILQGKKAISSHFPCWLITKDLTIKNIKVEGNSELPKSVAGSPHRKAVIFHVKTEGGQGIKHKILNNKNLKDIADEVSVYAFEGETVEEALKRDGRFKSDVFSKYALRKLSDDKRNDRNTKWSNDVKHLDGKTFRIIQGKMSAPLKREPGPSSSPSPSASSPQPSAPRVSINTDMAAKTAKPNTCPTLAKPKLTLEKRQELRVEYGKNSSFFPYSTRSSCLFAICNTVRMHMQLMDLAHSVCQVRVEGTGRGSGFLLFDQFILTNAHVIKDFYNDRTKQLTQKVTVSFCFLDLESPVDSVQVKPEVVVFNYNIYVETGFYYDWALLELDSGLAKNIPCGLLEHFATPPQKGGICIIGHPDGGVKKTDTCLTIPGDESETVALDRYKADQHLVTKRLFGRFEVAHLKNQRTDLYYDSCFFYGSSGSPVFGEFCNVVAMHTGGYVYETKHREGQTQSLIEYAQPLYRILPRIIIHIVERQRFDVLEAYLHYTSGHPKRKATWDELKEKVVMIGNMEMNPTVVEEFLERYGRHNQELEDMDTN